MVVSRWSQNSPTLVPPESGWISGLANKWSRKSRTEPSCHSRRISRARLRAHGTALGYAPSSRPSRLGQRSGQYMSRAAGSGGISGGVSAAARLFSAGIAVPIGGSGCVLGALMACSPSAVGSHGSSAGPRTRPRHSRDPEGSGSSRKVRGPRVLDCHAPSRLRFVG